MPVDQVPFLASAERVNQEVKSLIAQDLRASQEVVENTLPLLLAQLKQTDVHSYGRFVKRLRRMISSDAYTATPADSARVEELAVMKNNPIWPEIVKRIENQGE